MKGRSVVEVVVLALTGVVVFSIMAVGITIAIVEIRDPTTDTSGMVDALSSIVSGIIGALLGLIAGRAEAMSSLGTRPGDDELER